MIHSVGVVAYIRVDPAVPVAFHLPRLIWRMFSRLRRAFEFSPTWHKLAGRRPGPVPASPVWATLPRASTASRALLLPARRKKKKEDKDQSGLFGGGS